MNIDHCNIIDISPLVSEKIAVFPGDQAFSRQESLHFEKGHNLVLSSINTTVHLGAHTDAPIHYHPNGKGIDQRRLSLYVGSCQVVTANVNRGARITPKDISNIAIKCPRVLFKTNSFPNPDQWNGDFNSLSPELIQYLADKGVRLVGIDTPSVDPADDKELLTHNCIYKNDMAILEGIILGQVEDGVYTLVALPLKLSGADASPVRAVLLKEK